VSDELLDEKRISGRAPEDRRDEARLRRCAQNPLELLRDCAFRQPLQVQDREAASIRDLKVTSFDLIVSRRAEER
jgi:hypothetical protein